MTPRGSHHLLLLLDFSGIFLNLKKDSNSMSSNCFEEFNVVYMDNEVFRSMSTMVTNVWNQFLKQKKDRIFITTTDNVFCHFHCWLSPLLLLLWQLSSLLPFSASSSLSFLFCHNAHDIFFQTIVSDPE